MAQINISITRNDGTSANLGVTIEDASAQDFLVAIADLASAKLTEVTAEATEA